jgi:hypothetical protein
MAANPNLFVQQQVTTAVFAGEGFSTPKPR